VEVEAIDSSGKIGIELLRQQCNRYADLFDIHPGDFISLSYSDMLLQNELKV